MNTNDTSWTFPTASSKKRNNMDAIVFGSDNTLDESLMETSVNTKTDDSIERAVEYIQKEIPEVSITSSEPDEGKLTSTNSEPEAEAMVDREEGSTSPQIEKQYFWNTGGESNQVDLQDPEALTVEKHNFSLRKRRENVVPESVQYQPRTDVQRRKTLVPKSEHDRTMIEQVLQKHFLFESLSSKERFEVIDVMDKKDMPSDYCLINQGDAGDFFYVVASGEFDVVKSEITYTSVGTEIIKEKAVGTLAAGSCCGELALLYGRKRAATVRSKTAARVWSLDRITFKQILQSSSQHDLHAAQEALRKVPLLKALTDSQVEQCSEVVRFREFKEGEQIITKGDVGDVFYIIKSGKVLCSGGLSIHEDKESSIQLHENDYFGERALLKEEPRAANVFAITDVSVMTLDRHAFTTILGPLRQVLDDNIRSFVLQEIPVFRCLTTDERLAIFQAFSTREYKKGDVIIRQGDVGTTFYVLRSGQAEVTQDVQMNLREPVTTLLYTLKIGDYFGEMALLDGKKREANVIATEDCTCFCLDTKSFEELLAPSREVLNKDVSQRRRDNMIKRNKLSSRIHREQEIMRMLEDPEQTWPSQASPRHGDSPQTWEKPNREAVKQMKQKARENLEREAETAQENNNQEEQESRRTNFFIQDFQGVRTLGTGTFGRVKLVRHVHTHRTFALKIQSKAKIVKYKLQQNILNEKAVMERLNHPFINCLHQTFQDQDCLYMLLELVQGGELFSLLQTIGPVLKTHHHRFYIACVISAFEAMHQQDILYRDLKPENLLIDAFGYLKIVDFGFAKVVKHRTYTLCGTPEYFSPELVLGKGYGKGNDVWSVGILAYEVMNGFTPFGGADDKQNEIYKKVVQARLLFPKDCYDEIGMQLVSALLQKDVVNRLGCGRYGISAVRGHQWFRGLDWQALLKQKLKAPWVPKINNALDSSHFDVYDEDYRIDPFLCPKNQDPFVTF